VADQIPLQSLRLSHQTRGQLLDSVVVRKRTKQVFPSPCPADEIARNSKCKCPDFTARIAIIFPFFQKRHENFLRNFFRGSDRARHVERVPEYPAFKLPVKEDERVFFSGERGLQKFGVRPTVVAVHAGHQAFVALTFEPSLCLRASEWNSSRKVEEGR